MFPDSLATECALSDSRLKQKKVTISVIRTPYVQQVNDLVKKILMKYLSPTQRLHNFFFHRGYYMPAPRYEISLQVLKNISRVSAVNE